MAITYDSPDSDNFKTPVLLSKQPKLEFPIRQDLTAKIYVEEYCVRPDYFVPAPLDLPHPIHVNAYLITETNPQRMGTGGLFKFQRRYATVPSDRIEYATTNFSFPAYKTTSATDAELRASFSETCVAKIFYSYKLTADPTEDLVFSPKFQPLDASGNAQNFVASDTTPTKTEYEKFVTDKTFIQSAQTAVSRWKGNIWELQDIKVKAL